MKKIFLLILIINAYSPPVTNEANIYLATKTFFDNYLFEDKFKDNAVIY